MIAFFVVQRAHVETFLGHRKNRLKVFDKGYEDNGNNILTKKIEYAITRDKIYQTEEKLCYQKRSG